jgi:hypothetical protein
MDALENPVSHSAEFKRIQAALLSACDIPSLQALYRELAKWREYYEANAKKILDGIDYVDLEHWNEKFHRFNQEWLGARAVSKVEPPVERKIIRGFSPES